MSQAYNSVLTEDNVSILRDIVKRKQMMPLKMADGKMKVDLFTASAITQALDKVNDRNREKMEKMINTGKKSGILALQRVVMKNSYGEAYEIGTDEYRKYLQDLTPGEPINEELLEEGRMKELHGYIEDGKKADWIAKKMKLDVKTIRALMTKEGAQILAAACGKKPAGGGMSPGAMGGRVEAYVNAITKMVTEHTGDKPHPHPHEDEEEDDDVEEGAASDARRAMMRDKDLGRKKDSADDDDSATVDDVKAASKNIMMQLRKVVSLKGNFKVEFGNGKKEKIDVKVAQAAAQKYNSLRRPAEKEKFQSKIAKSKMDLLKTIKESLEEGFLYIEGTWHIAKDMSGLKKLMKKPIKLGKEGDAAQKAVAPYIGDDQLYDDFYDAARADGVKADARPLIKSAMKRLRIKEEVELDEAFDFVLLDKDNKIAGRYSGSNAKKEAESGKKSAHLPPMRIPKNEVGKMKIVPINPKDKKGIGDTVLAIGEDNPCWDGYKQVGMKDKGGKEVPNCVPEEVDLDEGYLELEFKDKRTAEQAYKYINNKIWSGGSAPYEDFNQEGNTLQIDTDGNLNRRNDMLKDLRALPSNMKFKVAVNEDGLWDNIHKKRKRGEKMRKKGDKGAPTDAAIKKSQEEVKIDIEEWKTLSANRRVAGGDQRRTENKKTVEEGDAEDRVRDKHKDQTMRDRDTKEREIGHAKVQDFQSALRDKKAERERKQRNEVLDRVASKLKERTNG